jgi:hypothetical protein
MTLKAHCTLVTIATLAALSGCQSGPRWAFWKHDSAPDSSAVARSAEPTLPSAQSTPQPVAVAGLTPAAPPSSANLAAANSPAASSVAVGTSALPPSMSIPVTSSATLANAPQAAYPNAANSLADKLTSAPSATTKAATTGLPTSSLPALPPTSATSHPLAAASAAPASGPYDPKAYKPTTGLAAAGADATGDASDADRYGIGSVGQHSASAPMSMPQSPANLPSNRYSAVAGSPSPAPTAPASTIAAAPAPSKQMPAQSPAPMSDRYAMPSTLPSSASMNPTTPVSPVTTNGPTASASFVSTTPVTPTATPVANQAPGIRTTAAVGTYRPGGTSSYTPGAAAAPIEVATRPAPPLPTAPVATPGAGSEPWAPPAPSAIPAATRTY